MRREYSPDELRVLKGIYDESGEAGLSREEMRALRKAGMLTQDLPPKPVAPLADGPADHQAIAKPEKAKPTGTNRHPEVREAVYQAIARHTRSHDSDGSPLPPISVYEQEVGLSRGAIWAQIKALVKDGKVVKDLEANRYRLPESIATLGKEKEMTVKTTEDASTMAERADKAVENAMHASEADDVAVQPASDTKPEEDTSAMNRRIIADRLGRLHDAALGVLSASFDAGDKVAHSYACKILSGELMDLKANYSSGKEQ